MTRLRNLLTLAAILNAFMAVGFYLAASSAASADPALCARFAMASVIHGMMAFGVLLLLRSGW